MNGIRSQDDETIFTKLTGYELLNNPRLNKGTAFTTAERSALGLHGLLAPHIGTLEDQRDRRYRGFVQLATPLEKYNFMRDLQDTNETLFYSLVEHHIEETLPIIYNPTVAMACQHFSEAWRKPRGLFLSYPNKDRIDQILSHPRYAGIKCIVVSDGECILGLGDQGTDGMGIPVGKVTLYTVLARIPPQFCLPILLDVGTNNQSLLQDPLYLGWRNPRLNGGEYDEFIDTFVSALKRHLPHVLLQWEDFSDLNAARFLERYRNQLCTFDDKVQGTTEVFPGLALGVISCHAKRVSQGMIDASALALAMFSEDNQQARQATSAPKLSNIHSLSQAVAKAVGQQALKEGLATVDQVGFEKELAANLWNPVYRAYKRVD
jgi:malate dehydrogenase (oxaloacetate-decarboxylating)